MQRQARSVWESPHSARVEEGLQGKGEGSRDSSGDSKDKARATVDTHSARVQEGHGQRRGPWDTKDRPRALCQVPWALCLLLSVVATPILSLLGACGLLWAWSGSHELALALVQGSPFPLLSSHSLSCPEGVRPQRFQNEPYTISGPVAWGELPEKVRDDYTLGGQIRVLEGYLKPRAPEERASAFNKSYIESLVKRAKSGLNICHYKCSYMFQRAFHEFPISGKSVVVLGSMLPWAEAHCLAAGARSVTTVDYNNPNFHHPGLRYLTPWELSESQELFDVAISYSSFEHDGLGRYGDPLHPTADLLRMKQVKNILNPGGMLFLGVPVGNDTLVFNQHRIYGPIRFPLLIKGWKLRATFGPSLAEKWRDNTNAQYHWQPLNVLSPE